MKPVLAIALILLLSSQVFPQNSLKKYPIGDSGCFAYFFAEPFPADLSYSPDSSRVYVMESMSSDSVTCSTITVMLAEEIPQEEIEGMMTNYLDYLKSNLNVTESTGYGRGVSLATHPGAKGIRDFWKDETSDISVISYSDGKVIEVMMIYAQDPEKDITNKRDAFFNGFRFPGD